ncbi:LysR family transcriptional regulator [Acetobacter sp. DsW_063]|uniref:LysR family transcriptional regulator n=1 Tax=Acetobacter sp. DsW_063 TaxID=1514894 RepID=UPI0035164BC5
MEDVVDLRVLRSFVTVAEERNFTRAAERLHIAQPPLSRQIQQLEAEVGALLIDRSQRPLSLTSVGWLVYEQAQRLLGQLNTMQEVLSRAIGAEKRHFALGFVSSTMFARLPTLIRGFRRRAQSVELTMSELVTLDQVAALKEGRIDIGFGRIRVEDSAIRRIVLREERLVVAMPELHAPEDPDARVSLQELARLPLIAYPRFPRPSYADQVLAVFHDHDLVPRVAHEARELQSAIGLVAAEEGICIVPESVRRSQMDGVCYRELVEEASSPIIMSYRSGDQSPELIVMAHTIKEIYSDLGYPIPDGIQTLAGTGPAFT